MEPKEDKRPRRLMSVGEKEALTLKCLELAIMATNKPAAIEDIIKTADIIFDWAIGPVL
jgi:hypothetical protein